MFESHLRAHSFYYEKVYSYYWSSFSILYRRSCWKHTFIYTLSYSWSIYDSKCLWYLKSSFIFIYLKYRFHYLLCFNLVSFILQFYLQITIYHHCVVETVMKTYNLYLKFYPSCFIIDRTFIIRNCDIFYNTRDY